MIIKEIAGIPGKKADTGMKPTPIADQGQGGGDKAQKDLKVPEYSTKSYWE